MNLETLIKTALKKCVRNQTSIYRCVILYNIPAILDLASSAELDSVCDGSLNS